MTIQSNDTVRVKGCHGTAKVQGYSRKYKVYILDRKMTDRNGIAYWSWEKKDIIKLERKLVRRL